MLKSIAELLNIVSSIYLQEKLGIVILAIAQKELKKWTATQVRDILSLLRKYKD